MRFLRKILPVLLILATLVSVSAISAPVCADGEMSEEFKSILTDGKFVFNCVRP